MRSRSNEEWTSALRQAGPDQEAALADLHAIILAGLPYALSQYLSPGDPEFESLAENTAQETLLRVLDRLDTFQGRGQFTAWVHKIAIRIALTELRRKRWENVSLEGLVEDEEHPAPAGIMADSKPGPEAIVEGADLMMRIQRVIREELTAKQRQAMMAINVQGMPIEEVARRMGTNRNALYKLLHDGRLRLKHRLAREGLTPEDILSAFEQE
ncbi:MAG TPA: RNA polymerase sigma factor [Anaerolineales bacterium]|nr:RNA polymerase sigma factor [Anaerolineales bacterium]